jgi:hypothetical protein
LFFYGQQNASVNICGASLVNVFGIILSYILFIFIASIVELQLWFCSLTSKQLSKIFWFVVSSTRKTSVTVTTFLLVNDAPNAQNVITKHAIISSDFIDVIDAINLSKDKKFILILMSFFLFLSNIIYISKLGFLCAFGFVRGFLRSRTSYENFTLRYREKC